MLMSEVGFEPTLLSKPELKSGALDHSAILTCKLMIYQSASVKKLNNIAHKIHEEPRLTSRDRKVLRAIQYSHWPGGMTENVTTQSP